MSLLGHVSRQYEFARHIPARQLGRRIYLVCKRRLAGLVMRPRPLPNWHGNSPKILTSAGIPSPHGRLERTETGWRVEFLYKSEVMDGQIAWNARADDARAQLWRMNLHYFEYLPDLDTADAIDLIDDWISRCRLYMRGSTHAAWAPYTVSLRLSAWLEFWWRNGPVGSDEFQRRFTASVREQIGYLVANLETDVCGNHLIKNIRTLTEVSLCFDDSQAAAWKKRADALLLRELDIQILPDGVHFELSPSYHAQVFADLLTIASLRDRDGLSDKLDDCLDRMAQALVDLTHPDGYPAQFGDAGLNMAASAKDCLEAYEKIRCKPRPTPKTHFAMTSAGYYGARHGGDYIIVKMGKLGPDSLMAHAHGDWGSFEWSIHGERVIVDQGVYEYVDGEKRQQARSTLSHNTATVNDMEQADFFGAFRCGRRPTPTNPSYEPTNSGFKLAGEIKIPAKPNPYHLSRTIEKSKDMLTINDDCKGLKSPAKLSSRILLRGPTNFAPQTAGNRLVSSGQAPLAVELHKGNTLTYHICNQWPNMGGELKTKRIIGEGTIETSLTIRSTDSSKLTTQP